MIDPTELTLEEKAAVASGAGFNTETARDSPGVRLADGPHGVRKQEDAVDHLGIATSMPATCFPPAAGLSQSWNTALVERIGTALGHESRAAGVDVLLGPGVNIKRHPLGGRNFEYFSEDPHLTAALGSAWVTGIQSAGVGASLKHFAANNQETDRHRVSSDIDPRTLHEIYLRAFQRVVQDAKPWTVMSSYNRVNGVPASENHFLLTEVLRAQWGFDGLIISDFGAVTDIVAAARAGLDLAMPAADGADGELLDAVRTGSLPESVLDRIVKRVAALDAKVGADRGDTQFFDVDVHHALAREAAIQSIVLLKNEGDILPLSPKTSVAVIGEGAKVPRFQGAGSSFVHAAKVDIPLDELQKLGGASTVSYSAGYTSDGSASAADLVEEAVTNAKTTDVAVVFVTAPIESEGFDREDMELPADQLALVNAVHRANSNTVVVLARGGTQRLAPLADIPAILDGALLGQGIGRAIAEIIYGVSNPSGRLSETVPQRIEDTPAYGNFPGEHGHVLYGEGLLVGYRWYDARRIPTTFPFGHGLSYTSFEYADLRLEATPEAISATVTITNTGDRPGREVAQFYVSVPGSKVFRAPRELKGFSSIELNPGESDTATVRLRRDDLSYWDIRTNRWILESGEYLISVGASSRDIRAIGSVTVDGDVVAVPLTLQSTIGELLSNPVTGPAIERVLNAAFGSGNNESVGGNVIKMISPTPLHSVIGLLGEAFKLDQFEKLLVSANSVCVPPPGQA